MQLDLNKIYGIDKQPHLDAIIDVFKNQKNLRLVIGAGEMPEHYEKFKNYTFILGSDISDFAETKIYGPTKDEAVKKITANFEKHEPIFIPIEIPSIQFNNFFNNFKNKFKDIIFDKCVSHLVNPTQEEMKIFFAIIQPGGNFYTDVKGPGPASGFIHELRVLMQETGFIEVQRGTNIKINKITSKWTSFIFSNPKLFCNSFVIRGEKTSYSVVPEDACSLTPEGYCYIPSKDYKINYIKTFLEKVGFQVKYIKSGKYPLYSRFDPEFEHYDYICATKPGGATDDLKLHLEQLKNSLSQLKIKLSMLEEKLKMLQQKLDEKTPAKHAGIQASSLKEIVINSKAEIAQKFKEITDGKAPVALIVNFDIDSNEKHFEFDDQNVNKFIKKIKFNVYPTWGHVSSEDESLKLDELDLGAFSKSQRKDELVVDLRFCPKMLILPKNSVFRENFGYSKIDGGNPIEIIDFSEFDSAGEIGLFLNNVVTGPVTRIKVPKGMKAEVEQLMQGKNIKVVD